MTAPKYPWPPPSLEDWCRDVDQDPAPAWHLQDILPADAAVLVSGRAKLAYKSWFSNAMVIAMATGKPYSLLQPVNPAGINCLVLALEGPRKASRARWDWQFNTAGAQIPPGKIWHAHRYPVILNDPEWQARIRDFVQAQNIQCVVIDTLAKASQGDENSKADVSDIMRAVDAVRSGGTGVSVIYLHHLRKPATAPTSTPDIDDDIRGSSALAGFYDTHLAFRETGGKGLTLVVRQKDAAEKYYRVQWHIQQDLRQARLDMEMYDPEAAPAADMCFDKLNKMEMGKVYSWAQLTELWEVPGEVTGKIAHSLIQAATVERTAKGFKRVL